MLQLPRNGYTYGTYVLIMALLTLATFGSLSNHLFDSDDREYIEYAAALLETPTLLLSVRNAFSYGRPTAELVFIVCYLLGGDGPLAYHIFLIILHLVAALLLAYTLRRLGAGLELSLLASLLFLMNVSHFQAVHWISCLGYILALIFGLSVLVCHIRFLESNRLRWLGAAVLSLIVAVCAHISAASVALYCIYLGWRKGQSVRRIAASTGPLVVAGLLSYGLLYTLYPDAPQNAAVASLHLDATRILKALLEYCGRLVTTAHWLPSGLSVDRPHLLNLGVGFLLCMGIWPLYRWRVFPVLDGIVWAILALLPFVSHHSPWGPPVYPARYFYVPSAGVSFALAWVLLRLSVQVGNRFGYRWGHITFYILLCGLLASSFSALKRSEAISFYTSSRAYVAHQNYELGVKQLKRAVVRDVSILPSDAYLRLAVNAFGLGDPVRDILQKAVEKDPDSPQLNLLLGASAYLRGGPEAWHQDEERLNRALNSAEDRDRIRWEGSRVLLSIGTYYLGEEAYEMAANFFREAITLWPQYSLALYNLGLSLHAQGRVEEAAQTYWKVLSIDPRDPMALKNLSDIGWFHYNQGEIDKALAIYQKILAGAPDNADAHFNLGIIHYNKDCYAEAAFAFQQAARLSPNDWEAHFSLAQSYEKLGRTDEAIAEYRRVLTLHPDTPTAETNLKNLLRGKVSQ